MPWHMNDAIFPLKFAKSLEWDNANRYHPLCPSLSTCILAYSQCSTSFPLSTSQHNSSFTHINMALQTQHSSLHSLPYTRQPSYVSAMSSSSKNPQYIVHTQTCHRDILCTQVTNTRAWLAKWDKGFLRVSSLHVLVFVHKIFLWLSLWTTLKWAIITVCP